jgi:NADH-quinone oxidoreductase subunit E
MSLTPQDVEEITSLAGHYQEPRGASVEALRIVQRRHRWVCDSDLGEVARLLGMTADELDAVATFYNLVFRRPVGRHVVLACDSVSCWIMGGDALSQRLRARLGIGWGETTPDGRFTLLPIVCLGACDHAPAVMIDDDLHGDLEAGDMDRVLEGYP